MGGDMRNPQKRAVVAERRARVVNMRLAGNTPAQIAARLELPIHIVSNDLNRALKERSKDLSKGIEEIRALESEKLDAMERAAWKTLSHKHFVVSAAGKVARNPETGELLMDMGPIHQAIGSLLRIQERRAKLLGLDATHKTAVEVTSADTTEVNSEIARIFSELVAAGPRAPEGDGRIQPVEGDGAPGPATPRGELENGIPEGRERLGEDLERGSHPGGVDSGGSGTG